MTSYDGKFAVLAEQPASNPRKRVRQSTRSNSATSAYSDMDADMVTDTFTVPSKNDFASMNIDHKMNIMFDMMVNMGNTHGRLDQITESVYYNSARSDITEARLRVLEYKSIDMEARLLRNNLLFTGHAEVLNADDCYEIIKLHLVEKLEMDPMNFHITKAYRIGKRQSTRARGVTRHRPILVSFRDANDVDVIMEKARLLANTECGISRDYPREISDARRELWADYKQAKSKYGTKNVKLKFPAALEINGDIVRDLFPKWYETLRGSRNSNVQARIKERYARTVQAAVKRHSGGIPQPARLASNVTESIDTESSDAEAIESQVKDTVVSSGNTHGTDSVQSSSSPSSPKTTAAGYLLEVHAPMKSSLPKAPAAVTVPAASTDVSRPDSNSDPTADTKKA